MSDSMPLTHAETIQIMLHTNYRTLHCTLFSGLWSDWTIAHLLTYRNNCLTAQVSGPSSTVLNTKHLLARWTRYVCLKIDGMHSLLVIDNQAMNVLRPLVAYIAKFLCIIEHAHVAHLLDVVSVKPLIGHNGLGSPGEHSMSMANTHLRCALMVARI